MTPGTTRAVMLGLLAAVFFSVTFLLNRRMGLAGGDWGWMACLRFFVMAGLLAGAVTLRAEWRPLLRDLAAHWPTWLLWSTIGFGVFYAPLTYASTITPAWLQAATWQLTILMGLLLSPLLYSDDRRRLPRGALAISTLIVTGVVLMQLDAATPLHGPQHPWRSVALILLAALAYPLGNRAIMLHLERADVSLSVYQRVLGMTIASLPFWLLIAATAYHRSGLPTNSEVVQAALIALSSGVIATLLLFRATDLVRSHTLSLAAVEATQAAEVLFVLLGEVLFLGTAWPGRQALVGLTLVLLGLSAYAARAHLALTPTRVKVLG
jgi:drug/metabolite transporter (DMT)-like permease